LKKYPIVDLNTVAPNVGTGLLGITSLSKDNLWYVFLFNSEKLGNYDGKESENAVRHKVYRYIWNPISLELTDKVTLSDIISMHSSSKNGGKLAIGPDEQLYVTLGDMNREGREQNIPREEPYGNTFLGSGSKSSAIMRLTIDGIPSYNNPFTEKGFESYYAFGIRNSFGIAFDPLTGNLWDTEQGPGTFDEINLVKPGFNSGWKSIQGNSSEPCCNNNLELSQNIYKIFNIRGSDYYEPKVVFDNSFGITDLEFLNSSVLGPNYINTMFVADRQGNVYNFNLSQDRERIIHSDNLTDNILISNLGPISDLNTGPDGSLYISTYTNATAPPYNENTGSIYTVSTKNLNPIRSEQDLIATELIAIAITFLVIAIFFFLLFRKKIPLHSVKHIIKRK
jgi:glucose/arabinose dehydrogenase